ncbi:MAG: response regulator transcription factor [Haliea sp.]
MRVLLVEDNARLSSFIKKGLSAEGFTIDLFGTVSEAEAALETIQYNVVVLDLGLPDGDGLELLGRLRKQGSAIPVLILTARDGVEDRVLGLNRGGDDYMLKPFAMEELVARMRALMRRPGGALGVTLTAGNVSFDTTAREVCVSEQPISISRREMGVLEQLMRRHGRVVPKDVLEDRIYGFEQQVASNSVEVHISRLRKRLLNAGATINIHTLRGVGYLLSEENR